MIKVLLVEDEEAYVDALVISLEAEGYEVVAAADGAQALELFDAFDPEVVLLDLMLPKVSGMDVCREIRAKSKVPIIMLTARSSEADIVEGLGVGADDYITKPYRIRELVARIGSVMRRASDDGDQEGALSAGPIVIDRDSHEVIVSGERVAFPLREFNLLEQLVANAGRVMARGTLIELIWGKDYYGDTKTLDVHIKRIRSKIEAVPSQPELVVTVRGVGYKFVAPEVVS